VINSVTVIFHDRDGNIYSLYNNGQLFLKLKRKPLKGKQYRFLGWVCSGIFYCHRVDWHRNHRCWYIARLPLYKLKSFGIVVLNVEARDGSGRIHKGWVYPEVIKAHGKSCYEKDKGYEYQLAIEIGDLKPTRELARKEIRGL
jgi:hypothetical protein